MRASEIYMVFRDPYHAIRTEADQQAFGKSYICYFHGELLRLVDIRKGMKETCIRELNAKSNRVMRKLISFDGRKMFKKDLVKLQFGDES